MFPKAMRAKGSRNSTRMMPIEKSWQANQSVCAALAEMRGDWSMYKEVLDFPSWSAKGHICWLCNATKTDLKDFSNATFEKCLV